MDVAYRVEADCVYRAVSCCPKKFPCPDCGKPVTRKQKLKRQVRTIHFGKIAWLNLTYAEYRAKCDCCKTFRSTVAGVGPGWLYDQNVRQAVLDRLIDDRMSVQKLLTALKRDFLLDLSEGFVYDCLHDAVAKLDMLPYRQWTLEQFSGTMCVDELHLGQYTLLLATDPLGDFPIAFALVDKNDQKHMQRFLGNLRNKGFSPAVVITDRSSLYPAVLADLWPEAQHQWCIFHVMQDISNGVLSVIKRLRREMTRRGNRGRRRRRGRPKGKPKQRTLTLKDKAHFIFKHRFLIVKRRENMSDDEQVGLATMLSYCSELKTLRTFMDKTFELFDADQTRHQAGCRRSALARQDTFQVIPELAKIIEMLKPENFEKMVTFLRRPGDQQVRTNNHVERANRQLRYLEKVRYKWRKRRSIVRFILLALQQAWKTHPNRKDKSTPQPRKNGTKTEFQTQTLSA